MSTSGSNTFTVSAGEIITSALRLVKALKPGQSPSTDMMSDGLQFLNMLAKSWQADSLYIWARKQGTLTLVADQVSYTLGDGGDLDVAKPLRIIDIFRRDSSDNDTPVTLISSQEYNMLGDKSSSGKIVQAYYDTQLDSGTLYVWPASDNATDTLIITYRRPFEDFDDTGDTPDFPKEWYLAIVYGLAAILGDAYPTVDPITLSRVNKKAYMLYDQIRNWAVEDTSLFFQPEYYQ